MEYARQAMKNIAFLSRLLLISVLLVPLTCSCAVKNLTQATPLDEYKAFLKSGITKSKTIDMEALSAAVIVKALPFTQAVETRARLLFQADPIVTRELAGWRHNPKDKRQAPFIVIMGLFAPDLGEKDITETGRFRPRLKTPGGGTVLDAAEIKRYGRDSVFMRDYFPVFDPWEEVFLIKFDPAYSLGIFSTNPEHYEFILEWPGGAQILTLGNASAVK